MRSKLIQSLLRNIDQDAISAAAKIETRNREHHLPPVSVYRWWARRTETVNGALLDAALRELPGRKELLVADPFAGGGVIPLAALTRGHKVYAQDLNPWVAKGLAAMLGLPPAEKIAKAGERLLEKAKDLAQNAYGTSFSDGSPAQISHALRVPASRCGSCGHEHRLFPHAMVTLLKRKEADKPEAILACSHGHLFHARHDSVSKCPECREKVDPARTYVEDRIIRCPSCGHEETLESRAQNGYWRWELAIVERSDGVRRELGFPTKAECAKASNNGWKPKRSLGEIPADAQEARVLTRHGFECWDDIYPARQRYVIEELLKHARSVRDKNVRAALEMAVLGTTEMAGLLSRWDRYYLKSYESMAAHRFNFSTLVAEPNVIGAGAHGRGTLFRRLKLLERAARWLVDNGASVSPRGPVPSAVRRFNKIGKARATVVVGSSERMLLPTSSVDLVVTDPPYHDDVQYHELSLPLRAWAGLDTSRLSGEAVAIPHSAALSSHKEYRGILTRIFKELRRVLRSDGRLLFSYANREVAAWVNVFAALRAAGFRPVGYTILHSENEQDHLKRKGRSCHLDLILELVPSGRSPIQPWRPRPLFNSDEERFLVAIGDAFLQSSGMVNGWESELLKQVRSDIFVSRTDKELRKQAKGGAKKQAADGWPARVHRR